MSINGSTCIPEVNHLMFVLVNPRLWIRGFGDRYLGKWGWELKFLKTWKQNLASSALPTTPFSPPPLSLGSTLLLIQMEAINKSFCCSIEMPFSHIKELYCCSSFLSAFFFFFPSVRIILKLKLSDTTVDFSLHVYPVMAGKKFSLWLDVVLKFNKSLFPISEIILLCRTCKIYPVASSYQDAKWVRWDYNYIIIFLFVISYPSWK